MLIITKLDDNITEVNNIIKSTNSKYNTRSKDEYKSVNPVAFKNFLKKIKKIFSLSEENENFKIIKEIINKNSKINLEILTEKTNLKLLEDMSNELNEIISRYKNGARRVMN